MKWQSPLFVIILVAGIVIIVSVGEIYTPQMNPHSSKNRDLEGTLALYLLLEKYTAVERVETSFENLGPGTLLMIGPVKTPSSQEMTSLLAWVQQGNRVVVFSDDPQVMQAFGANLSSPGDHVAVIPPSQEHWSTRNVRAIKLYYHRSFTSYEGDVLFADRNNPVVVAVTKGEGEIFLINDTSLAWNINILNEDNGIFLVQVSLADKVYFDEYHLYALKRERGITLEALKSVFVSGYSSFFIQLVMAVTLFLVAHGKRFGVLRPVRPPEVQSSELVFSAADLYHRAGKKEVLKILEEKKKKYEKTQEKDENWNENEMRGV